MPLYATLASIIVALIPPLQHALVEDVPAVKGFLTQAGSCAVPLNMLVLGAYFYQEPEKDCHIDTRADEGNHMGSGTSVDLELAQGAGQSGTDGLKSPLAVRNYGAVQETRQAPNDGRGSECNTGITVTVIRSDLSSPINDGNGNVREGETKTVLAAIISRMILTPMIVLPTMAAFAMMNLHPAFKE